MRSIRMGLGAKSTGNGKSVAPVSNANEALRVSSRIKSANEKIAKEKLFLKSYLTVY